MWKSALVGLSGIWLLVAPFVVPTYVDNVYNNWLFGLIVTNAAIVMSDRRTWERPIAAGFGIWLFMSGFVPSVLRGGALVKNDLLIGAVLIVSAISAGIHLRQDLREPQPLA